MTFPKIYILIPIIFVMCCVSGFYASSWTEPTQTYPNGNVALPLNTSITGQSKAGGLILNTGGADHGLIVQTGNVGIGTADPYAGLEINMGATNRMALRVTSAGWGWGSGMQFQNTSTNGKGYGIYSDANGYWRFVDTSASDVLTISPTGNVGVGNTSPSRKLDVSGVMNATQYCIGGANCISSWPSGTNLWTDQGTYVYPNNFSQFAIMDTGRIGIGTTAPGSSKLYISDGTSTDSSGYGIAMQTIANTRSGVENYALLTLTAPTYDWQVRNQGGSPRNLGDGFTIAQVDKSTGAATARMVINNNGSFGFGEVPISGSDSAKMQIAHWAIPMQFRETDRAVNSGGLWRMPLDGGVLRFDVNTAAGGDFSTNIMGVLALTADGSVAVGTIGASGYKFYVNGSSYSTGGWASSDLRLKENIEQLTDVTDKLENIEGVKFDWKVNEFPNRNFSKSRQIGLIAQDVEKEFPELVNTDKDGFKSVAYDKFTAVLLEAIKEQKKEIDSLKQEVEILKAKN